MSSPVNKKVAYAAAVTGAQEAIQLNRWGVPDLSVNLTFGSTGSVSFEGTLDYVNRPDATPVWFEVIAASTTGAFATLPNTPLEAIRANIGSNGGGVNIHVMQSGSTDE